MFRKVKKVVCFVMMAMVITLVSCVDDKLAIIEPGVSGGTAEEGDALCFTMKLDRDMSGSRSSRSSGAIIPTDAQITVDYMNQYENFVDTQDKFRVFFFTKEGEFLFGAIDRTVSSLDNNTALDASYWQVRIPMNLLVDRQGNLYPLEMLKDYLRHNEFKVAVLANWPNANQKIYPGDYDDSEENAGKDNPVSTLKGHPIWGLKNSVLYQYMYDRRTIDQYKNECDYDKIGEPNVKNINDLHHIYNDTYYSNDEGTDAKPSRFSCYKAFMPEVTEANADGTNETFKGMGQLTEWVAYRDLNEGWHSPGGRDMDPNVPPFDSKETANAWIRANCTPNITLNQNKQIYRQYQHLWLLWNFDASYKAYVDGARFSKSTSGGKTYYTVTSWPSSYSGGKDPYASNWGWNDDSPATVTNPFGKEWFARNGAELYEWMYASYSGNRNLTEKTIQIGDDVNGVKFACYGTGHKVVKVGNNYGIRLSSQGSTKPTDKTPGNSLHFIARTSGTVRVKWSSSVAGQSCSLTVQKNSGSDAKADVKGSSSTSPQDYYSTTTDNFLDISVGDASTPSVYIYSPSGNAVIYSIEFIRGKYLSDTDRQGVIPGEEQGIPMYGVQNFQPLSDWEDGQTLDMSASDKTVYLLRALARVDFYVPMSFGQPQHVYLKSSNKVARCEPIDVETPTDQLWHASHYNNQNDKCEWFYIQNYGPFYDSSGVNLEGYKTMLSWFYRSWNQTATWNVGKYTIGNDGKWTPASTGHYSVPSGVSLTWSTAGNYPHIFNPAINRSDFCHFLYAGHDGTNYHYVLYTPEKYIDDPTNPAIRNSTPKVPHIEFRFSPTNTMAGDKNSEFNLDDNDTHRIYFTNYGNNGEGMGNLPVNTDITASTMTLSGYDDYEKNTDHLKKHWPIMRNHTYEFYLSGTGPENFTVKTRVKEWGYEKVTLDW